MKVLGAEQIREADLQTIKNEPIASIELMERAGKKCADRIEELLNEGFAFSGSQTQVCIVSGPGNNGGDGLVVARYLKERGFEVEVLILDLSGNFSDDFSANLERLRAMVPDPEYLRSEKDFDNLENCSLIVDAIFGTGLNRKTDGLALKLIQYMNSLEVPVISIDMPSGLFDFDNSQNDPEGIVQAELVLTFQVPKFAFFLEENSRFARNVDILDIGLDQEFLDKVSTDTYMLERQLLNGILKSRGRFSHKGTFGHSLIIGGATGKWGAPILSASAALRSGAGLVTTHLGKAGILPMHASHPEVMISEDENTDHFTSLPDLSPYDSIAIGPGLGMHEDSRRAFKRLIQESHVPLVIDADAINILSENKTWLAFLPQGSILTPHPGEFQRLTGVKDTHFQRILAQRAFCRKYQVHLVLKGAFTSICDPSGTIYFNTTGNPGMATAGMGDALTGVIAGLLASGYSSLESCLLGVYVHGLAGDIALEEQSELSLISSDLIRTLGKAFLALEEI